MAHRGKTTPAGRPWRQPSRPTAAGQAAQAPPLWDGALPVVTEWFTRTFGAPSAPQRRGWPLIAAGENTLILAPTGSGKTLAAFLACLNRLWSEPDREPGVHVLYLSPLKALNADIALNLETPLHGVQALAEERGEPLPPIRTAVRTGDTTAEERRSQARRPPDVLITTPESLHLLLTSRARAGLRTVRHVIVDEIHALCGDKRGVFLALLLERLAELTREEFVRIGLSATQRPLEAVARYLGGYRWEVSDLGERLAPRSVAIVDEGAAKRLDLGVEFPPARTAGASDRTGERSVWPAIERRVFELIDAHRSTLVFANNRRVAERLTNRLNERDEAARTAPERAVDAVEPRIRAHHGSLSLDRRRQTERDLKSGALAAVVATASLELGIDMGPVDLVCQVESPGGVARSLQRIGRAGHTVGAASRGRLIAKTPADLLEAAALTKAMVANEIEPLVVPENCLDVLAQQVAATVAEQPMGVASLFRLVRRAAPYRNLGADQFEAVLEMLAGRRGGTDWRDLRPLVSWDRVGNRLLPLPGTKHKALTGGGTIPETGQYPVHLGAGGPRLGTLDEEFVLERRVGESFVLGTSTWKIEAIEPDRVVVAPAEGRTALAPFWRGEGAGRTALLGAAVGALSREIAERLDDPTLIGDLKSSCSLNDDSARALSRLVRRQLDRTGAVPSDRTVLVETFRDQIGELSLAILTSLGNRGHLALKLILQAVLKERLGVEVSALHGDAGVIVRLPEQDTPPTDLFAGLTPEVAEAALIDELGLSAFFGLRFRQNAGRALLLPRSAPNQRTPLWLQRLRARDLLQKLRQDPDHPLVVETYRDCLADLERDHLRRLLQGIQDGSIEVIERHGEVPSPFTAELVFAFEQTYLYQWDDPKRGDTRSERDLSETARERLLARASIEETALERFDTRLKGRDRPPRSEAELREWLRICGDLDSSECCGPIAGFLDALEAQGAVLRLELPRAEPSTRWVLAEDAATYRTAFLTDIGDAQPEAAVIEVRRAIVGRYLKTRALVGLEEIVRRYGFDREHARDLLDACVENGEAVALDAAEQSEEAPRWGDPRNVAGMRRFSVALRRRECVTVTPEVYADFLLIKQYVHPLARLEGASGLEAVLERLRGWVASAEHWERDLLPSRLTGYRPAWLDELMGRGDWVWIGRGGSGSAPLFTLAPRWFEGRIEPGPDAPAARSPSAVRILEHLDARGPATSIDLADALGLGPTALAQALNALVREGAITQASLEPLRTPMTPPPKPSADEGGRRGRLGRHRGRRAFEPRIEAPWSRVAPGPAEDEESLLAWSAALLDRYGVVCRETVGLESASPPWSRLASALDAAELRGEVRRGYFVEGLSGVQYALGDVADRLARHEFGMKHRECEPFLIRASDPANLYGSGAPFDIPLLEGGRARLPRSTAHAVVLSRGRPVLIAEQNGERLTLLPSASKEETARALGLLTGLAGPHQRVLKVRLIDGRPALGHAASEALIAAGFVRDPPGLAYYLGW